MPKVKISEYSTTNTDNSDIEGINIAEGCAPSGINNAIRELMVHLKEFQTGASGDPLTVAGTFVASGAGTINGTSIPASKTLADTNSAQTFTNKTISGSSNTITNVSLTSGVTGTLPIANGGTGDTTLAGAGIAQLGVAQTFSAKQIFSATTKVQETLEKMTVSATAATGTINYDALTQAALYYTSNASANWTVNFRGSSGASLDSIMATGESLTLAFLVTQGSTAYYNSAVQIDGNSVTPKWQGGAAPTSGNTSSIDLYVYNIVKTGSATFTVFASQTQFK